MELLSPKEQEERLRRAARLSRIDQEISNILSSSQQQHSQYSHTLNTLQMHYEAHQHLASKVNSLEQRYSTLQQEHQALEKAHAQLEDRYISLQKKYERLEEKCGCLEEKQSSMEAIYQSLKEELEQSTSGVCQVNRLNSQLEQEIARLKEMVSNQEGLIDQYRTSIEEEVALEKEFIKSQFQQKRSKMERQFSRALDQMEKKYQDRLKKAMKDNHWQEISQQFRQFKKGMSRKQSIKGLTDGKEGIPGRKGSVGDGNVPKSQYSTSDQENRHQQAIYLF